MIYARIENSQVVEVIQPFVKTEDMRPPMPEPLAEGADEMETLRHAELLAAHLNFELGEVPIEERYHPDFVATLVPVPEGVAVAEGYLYADGVFSAPPPYEPPPVTVEQVLAERSARMAAATAEIEPLRDLVDMGEASEADEANLLLWVKYRAAVSKIQTQPGFHSAVVWPTAPAI